MVNRSFADMRRTPVCPASCRAFFCPHAITIRQDRMACASLDYCLQRTTIERFFTFAPSTPPSEPPEVPPVSTSFEITS